MPTVVPASASGAFLGAPPSLPAFSRPPQSLRNVSSRRDKSSPVHGSAFGVARHLKRNKQRVATSAISFKDDRVIAPLHLAPTLAAVHGRILDKVGDPATTDPSTFPTRQDMGIDEYYPLHIDLGGEGHFSSHGVTCGFPNALNVNAQRTNSQNPDRLIPLLIPLIEWRDEPPIPLSDGTVNYVTLQSVPLTEWNVSEIARVLAPCGRVGLWIDLDAVNEDGTTILDRAHQLAALLKSKVRCNCSGPDRSMEGEACSEDCEDEFQGKYPFAKVCIVDHR